MAIVVSDTSPIRALHHLGLLNVLSALFETVYIPPAVDRELRRTTSRFGSLDVRAQGLIVAAPADLELVKHLMLELDAGESEAIALAIEVSAGTLLIDEFSGRSIARKRGLTVTGVLGFLVRAKARGLVGPVRPLIERLRTEIDFFISEAVLHEVLTSAGE